MAIYKETNNQVSLLQRLDVMPLLTVVLLLTTCAFYLWDM